MANLVKLDKIDCKLLFELDLNCRISDTRLAKKIGRSRESVKYRIKQLVDSGVIEKFITSINQAKFGVSYYKIFLQLENIPFEREKLCVFLSNKKEIPWFGLCSGVWDFIIGVSAKSPVEFDLIKNEIISNFKHLIIRKEIGVMVETMQFPKKFLLNSKSDAFVSFAGELSFLKTDLLDEKILDVLANNARLPLTVLSKQVNSNPKTIASRIKVLQEKNIIIGFRTSIDLSKIGFEFFKIMLFYRSITKKQESKLLQFVSQLPQSIYYVKMIAPWDAELELVVRNYSELNEVIDKLREEFPDVIRNFETVVINKENWLPSAGK